MVQRRYEYATESILGDKHIKKQSIPYDRLQPNTIYIRTLAANLEAKTGLAADSTGVKAESPRFKFSVKHVKQLILRGSITSIPSDATVRIELYNYTTGAVIAYLEFAGATGEKEATITTLPNDGDVIGIRVNVVTASATAGATFNLGYASLMIDYGVS